MTEPTDTTDQAIELVLELRAHRATPTGLLDQIEERLLMEPQQRSSPFGSILPRSRSIAWLLVLLAFLVALAIGAASLAGGSRPTQLANVAPPAPSASAGSDAFAEAICLTARPVPFDPANLQLSGTWTAASGIDYFHQIGNTLWVIGAGRVEPGSQFDKRAFRGTISGTTVQFDWAELGANTPADAADWPFADNGTITMRIEAGADGNTQLTSISQTGTSLDGAGFSTFTFKPCTIETLSVPSTAP
jgi:hypothetical protein